MKDTLDKYQFMVVILPLYIILSFLSIVPIVIVLRKKIKKYHNTYVNKEITFNVRGNNLYIGDTKLQIIKSLEDGKIYIDDFIINRLHIPSKGYINSYRVTFIGIIDKPYSDKFEEFMKSNDIKISFCKDKPNFF